MTSEVVITITAFKERLNLVNMPKYQLSLQVSVLLALHVAYRTGGPAPAVSFNCLAGQMQFHCVLNLAHGPEFGPGDLNPSGFR